MYACTNKKISHGHASPSGQTLLSTGPVIPVVHANPGNGNARIRCRNRETFEYRQLRQHPKYKGIREQSYSNEIGRLSQVIGYRIAGHKKQGVAGTETLQVIKHGDIPKDRLKKVTYTKVVCEVRPQKEDPNRRRRMFGYNRIIYPGEVVTPTAALELVKLIINSVLSLHGAKFACFDFKNFYLATPMDRSELVKIKIEDIPQYFLGI